MTSNWVHVYPINDLKYHDTESLNCECSPEIDWNENIVIHNAWDIREAQEFINEKEKQND